jgi:hypothetical protein
MADQRGLDLAIQTEKGSAALDLRPNALLKGDLNKKGVHKK